MKSSQKRLRKGLARLVVDAKKRNNGEYRVGLEGRGVQFFYLEQD